MSRTLACACGAPLTWKGRGRPPTTCDKCKRAQAAARQRKRRRTSRTSPVPAKASSASAWCAGSFYGLPDGGAKWSAPKFQRDLVDVFAADLAAGPSVVAVCKASQVGYSTAMQGALAYHLADKLRRCAIYMPSDDQARRYAKDTVAPLFDVVPALGDLAAQATDRRQLSLDLRVLPGGATLRLLGAVAPSRFRRYVADVVCLDELDDYQPDIGDEGDPVSLASRAVRNQGGRVVCGSTPTLQGGSLIEREVDRADLTFRYLVACPHCKALDALTWDRLTFDKGDDLMARAASARMACGQCGAEWQWPALAAAVERGRWETASGLWVDGGKLRDPAGGAVSWPSRVAFKIWAAYSVWWSWPKMVETWLRAQGDLRALKHFANTVRGESWTPPASGVDPTGLMARRESWDALPERALALTAGVDVQNDRIEAYLWAWCSTGEGWLVDTRTVRGETDSPKSPAYGELGDWLADARRSYARENGRPLTVDAVAVDCGFRQTVVMAAVREWRLRRVYAVKGKEGDRALVRHSKTDGLHILGVDALKLMVLDGLREDSAAPWHFPAWMESETAEQLAAERLRTTMVRGFPVQRWHLVRARNEALDAACYARAALEIAKPDWPALAKARAPTKPKPADPVVDNVDRLLRRRAA